MGIPCIIYGLVKDSRGEICESAIIEFSLSAGKKIILSNSSGQYTIDLDDIGYTDGEAVTYIAKDKYENEMYIGSTTAINQNLDINLSVRIDYEAPINNRSIQLANIGGKIVNRDNPLPVRFNELVNLPFDYIALTYSGSNLTKVVYKEGGSSGVTIATLTLGYSGSNLTSVTKT